MARSEVSLRESFADGETTFWLEGRPSEGGRYVVVRAEPGSEPHDVTPPGFSARTRVHEYGGGSYAIAGSTVFFSNDDDQRLYRQDVGGMPEPITAEPPVAKGLRYADMDLSPDERWIACVRERHGEQRLAVNELIVLPVEGSSEPVPIASGRDFYAFPRWSPDGRSLAFIEWDMPRMPWDGTDLRVVEIGDGSVGGSRHVAGGEAESIFQPSWSLDGRLHFVSDRTQWWNLYRDEPGSKAVNLTPIQAEFGVPMWQFGYSTVAHLSDGRIACLYRLEGEHHLALLDPGSGEMLDLDLPFTCFRPTLAASGSRLVVVAGGPRTPAQVVSIDLLSRDVEVIREGDELDVDPAFLSEARPIAFGSAGGRIAYGYHYPPTNPEARLPDGGRPPLIVLVHGGPTSETTPELDLQVQFFTSRGFAVADVNYGGSTGYGRAFRESLYGEWGVVDVEDAAAAARFLVEQGEADPERLVISGGSAGGWTTLCALTFGDTFATGTSYYGVSDLEPFATDTHKFELKYNDVLVGPWPEAVELWRARSPVRHAELMTRPVLILQGDEDPVVPPSQAEAIVDALDARDVPYAYLVFEGEQHGFRKAEHIARALEAELTFYVRILGLEAEPDLQPLEIRNLD
ncbi:MAG TPA: S9 family peptidase [Actinomycetota bacterium]